MQTSNKIHCNVSQELLWSLGLSVCHLGSHQYSAACLVLRMLQAFKHATPLQVLRSDKALFRIRSGISATTSGRREIISGRICGGRSTSSFGHHCRLEYIVHVSFV